MLAQGALGIERWRGAVDRIGGEHHLIEFFDGATSFVAHSVEIVRFRKLAKQVSDIGCDVGIVEAELALIAVPNSLLEEGFEWMSLGLHTHLP
jgi:hypothetical protein